MGVPGARRALSGPVRGADSPNVAHRFRVLLAALLLASLFLTTPGNDAATSPAEASVVGSDGSTLTLSGTDLPLTGAVMFGQPGQEVVVPSTPKCGTTTAAGCIVQQTANTIIVKAPANLPPGFQPVAVCANGASVTACQGSAVASVARGPGPNGQAGFSVGPTITKVSPVGGIGGTTITISGGKFGSSIPSVAFVDAQTGQVVFTIGGLNSAKCTPNQHGCIKQFSDTTITAIAPDNMPAAVYLLDVMVGSPPVHPTVLAATYFAFEPTIFSASPAGGAPGTMVTIKGTRFGRTSPALSVWFRGIGPNGTDLEVKTLCGNGGAVGCVVSRTDDTVVVKAPANDPSGAPVATIGMTLGGSPAADLSASSSATGQPTTTFSYVPTVNGTTGATWDKPGNKVQIKGVNFGSQAGVQIGPNLFVADRCTLARTDSCILTMTDQLIVVKPPATVTGPQAISVVVARMRSTGASYTVDAVTAPGGFTFTWTSGPILTGVS